MTQQQLHYLYEPTQDTQTRRFVCFCSECHFIFDVNRNLRPASKAIDVLENRCLSCGTRLDSSMVCKQTPVSERWTEITLSDFSARRASPRVRREDLFRSAFLPKGLAFGLRPLDDLVGCLDHNWFTVFTGDCANMVAELLCFRAQLPEEAGGLDSDIVFVDGGNCSDLYLFASYARSYGVQPKKSLRRVVTSRAFTIHQLANLLTSEVAKVIGDYSSKLVIVSDVLGMFNDPQLDAREASRVIDAIIAGIQKTRKIREREENVSVLATLTTKTPYNDAVTDRADLLLDLGAMDNSSLNATLLKHPLRYRASSQFKMKELLQPAPPVKQTIHNGKNHTLVQNS